MRKIYVLFLFSLSLGLFLSCKKDPKLLDSLKEDVAFTNDVAVNITNVADNAIVQVSKDTVYTTLTPKYINANNDTFSVTTLKYYISNVKLKRPDGSYYVEKESYHFIDAADTINTCRFVLKNVPVENYIAMEFIIGIDSARNCSGAQTGALNPLHDMFWSWNQGYIFYKFEGYTSSVPNFGIHNLTFHVGGFLAPYNMIRWANVPFNNTSLNIDAEHVSTLFIKANVLEAFRNPNTLDFTSLYTSTSGNSSKQLANNYTDMFSLAAIKH